ncbi:hypothetical protein GCM10010324_54790 [Streptomyces hiroshimensis]|uniref:Uncharacterized protein n=1 Tax=Streptomyces hiroshimensis TaxID=66424 RepID=A0ABQ2Z0D5_9ACTN|nr:hypothetical protein GCM10010324_54790 [Streptomyces hiroshimensis]
MSAGPDVVFDEDSLAGLTGLLPRAPGRATDKFRILSATTPPFLTDPHHVVEITNREPVQMTRPSGEPSATTHGHQHGRISREADHG